MTALLILYLLGILVLLRIIWQHIEPKPVAVIAVAFGWPLFAFATLVMLAFTWLTKPPESPYEDRE